LFPSSSCPTFAQKDKVMRVIDTITHPQCNITIYQWNNKYLIKLEQDVLEQTYKISEMDLTSPDDIQQIIDDEQFMAEALQRFDDMRKTLFEAMGKL
jgi:thiamine pyrophosphate-dependent acetolactate synthase large subunit-like protein